MFFYSYICQKIIIILSKHSDYMSKRFNTERYENLCEFIEEHLSRLVKLKVVTRASYHAYDECLFNYITAESIDDRTRMELFKTQVLFCYESIDMKLSKQLTANPDLAEDEVIAEMLQIMGKAKSKAPKQLSLFDDEDQGGNDHIDQLLKIAEKLNGKPLTKQQKEQFTEVFMDENKMARIMAEDDNTHYHYQAPDYNPLAQADTIDSTLSALMPNGNDDYRSNKTYKDLCENLSSWEHEKLSEQLTRLLYAHLADWHGTENAGYPFGLQAALALIEHFRLTECMPVILEILRQSRNFYDIFFTEDGLDDMPAAILSSMITKHELPMLLAFMKEPGLFSDCKSQVAFAVAHLPKLNLAMLKDVQQWLADVLNCYFPMGSDTTVFDEQLLDTLVYCCIHTRAVELKPLIIKLYGKYNIPPIMVSGGSNEVRKSIKNADLGTLDDENGEEMLLYSLEEDEEEWDDDEEEWDDDKEGWDEDEEDWEDAEEMADPDFNPDDYSRQEYDGWVEQSKAIYKPMLDVKAYTLRIELDYIKPVIWREVEVPSNLTLSSLAAVILLAMGWNEDHLHQFVVRHGLSSTYYSTSIHETAHDIAESGSRDGKKHCIGELLSNVGDKVTFEYDFGDSWMHTVKLIASAEYDRQKKEVKLLAGERACPLDDCGALPGYRELCEAMDRPYSSSAQRFMEWLDCRFDPEYFPLEMAQKAVASCNK